MATNHSFPVIDSKGAIGQRFIEAQPDADWEPKGPLPEGSAKPPILDKAGHLLVTGGQRLNTSRLTAVASDKKYVGNGWIPVTGMKPDTAKAAAVLINSTVGRLQLILRPSQTPDFPQYNLSVIADLMLPDPTDQQALKVLLDAWEQTRFTEVPVFREGECEVRRIWDDAVAEAIGVDRAVLTKQRLLLHQEPLVSGNNYGDVIVD